MTEALLANADDLLSPEKFPALGKAAWLDVLNRWKEPHRHWHSEHHLKSLLALIESEVSLTGPDREVLRCVALFHDAVYDPFSASNEEDSARLASEALGDYSRKVEVVQAILATKYHKATTPLEQKFNEWDCAILSEAQWDKLLFYEQGIAFEYSAVGDETYRRERGRFLRNAAQEYQNPLLKRLADEVDPR